MEETEVKSTIAQEKDEIQKETNTISVTNGIISTQAEGPESQNKEHGNVTRTQSEISSCSTVTSLSSRSSQKGISRVRKSVRNLPNFSEILAIQETFCERFIKTFLRKKTKYENVLRENGISVDCTDDGTLVNSDKTFEEEVEIIVSSEPETTVKCTGPWRRKSGRKYSLRSLVRHIYVVLRRTKAKRIISKLSDIPEDDLLDVLKSVSSELSIAYQYQIAILADDAEVYRAADFAVSCIMTHLRSKQSLFNPTEALQAVTEDTPSQYFPTGEYLRTKILKTDSIKGKRRQQWVLDEIFKQPGIRIPEPDGSGYKYYDCFTPYGYACRPEKYGFRGPLHVWNETEGKYTMIPNDVISCFSPRRHEVDFDTDNIHHTFLPVILCHHS